MSTIHRPIAANQTTAVSGPSVGQGLNSSALGLDPLQAHSSLRFSLGKWTAEEEIDRVLDTVERYKRPGYIEIPRDMVDVAHPHRPRRKTIEELTDVDALGECMAEATAMIDAAKRPVILAGVEVHRFGLQSLTMQHDHRKVSA